MFKTTKQIKKPQVLYLRHIHVLIFILKIVKVLLPSLVGVKIQRCIFISL